MADDRQVSELIEALGKAVGASFVAVRADAPTFGSALFWQSDDLDELFDASDLLASAQDHWSSQPRSVPGTVIDEFSMGAWRIAVTNLRGPGVREDLLAVGCLQSEAFSQGAGNLILAFARLIPIALEEAGQTSALDDLVTQLATELMPVSSATLQQALDRTIRLLSEFFSVDTAFVRRNDHSIEASILVAEWPLREDVPDPDPLGIVPFDGSDPVFAAIRDLSEPLVIRPGDAQDDYQDRVRDGAGIPQVALAMVPILQHDTTRGVLGFINFGDREWTKAELNALRAIASLLAQLDGRVEAEEQLHRGAYLDELTGLPNRRALQEFLTDRLDPSKTDPVAVIFIDLDRLKAVNDMLGHAAGDALLIAVSSLLRSALSSFDFVARLGGDEFVVVLAPGTVDVLAVAERLFQELSDCPTPIGGGEVTLAVSAGIAIGEPGETTSDKLVHDADVALLSAKADGGNRIAVFNEQLQSTGQAQAEINLHLSRAVPDGDLEVYYLPEIDLRSGRLIAVEALVRWHHPTRGLLLPGAFIELAEKSRAIVGMGEWVLNEACRQIAEWQRRYPETELLARVNVSPIQLMAVDMSRVVEAALSAHGLAGRNLCLELTEEAVMGDIARRACGWHSTTLAPATAPSASSSRCRSIR
jgi:diguanylate cyclase (GGDEF)-like protein